MKPDHRKPQRPGPTQLFFGGRGDTMTHSLKTRIKRTDGDRPTTIELEGWATISDNPRPDELKKIRNALMKAVADAIASVLPHGYGLGGDTIQLKADAWDRLLHPTDLPRTGDERADTDAWNRHVAEVLNEYKARLSPTKKRGARWPTE